MAQHAQQHRAGVVLVELAGLGLSLLQDLRHSPLPGLPHPIGIKPVGEKITRLEAASPRIEAGQVWRPREAPWLSDFLNELLAFPNGRHDDQVDSFSQFVNWQSQRALYQLAGGSSVHHSAEPGSDW